MLLSFVMFFVCHELRIFSRADPFLLSMAAFWFYFCVDAVFLSDYQSHRRQRIQVEDGTYVEAEWRMPRRFTDSPEDSARSKKNDSLKLVRLAAFGIVSGAMTGTVVGVMGAMVATQRTWQQQQQHLVTLF